GGLVGERDGEDRAGMDVALADQVRDPPGQYPGLARAGTRHHKHRATLVQHRLALGRVETLEQLLRRQPIALARAWLRPFSSQTVSQGALLPEHVREAGLDTALLNFTHGQTTLSARADCSVLPDRGGYI